MRLICQLPEIGPLFELDAEVPPPHAAKSTMAHASNGVKKLLTSLSPEPPRQAHLPAKTGEAGRISRRSFGGRQTSVQTLTCGDNQVKIS